MTKILHGTKLAEKLCLKFKTQIKKLKEKNIHPCLAVIIIGENPASKLYVNSKIKKCNEIGIISKKIALNNTIKQTELLQKLDELNADEKVNGILVQLPLPNHIDKKKVIEKISPNKDVDGFHEKNISKLFYGDPSALIPCTPQACLEILLHNKIPIKGKNVCIIGRSEIVGKSLALLLVNKGIDATPTLAHSKTNNLSTLTKNTDIIIAATGIPNLITADMVNKNTVIIDVGISRIDDPSEKKRYRVVGDVDYQNVYPIVKAITPVPGGVGPMTIAMLLQNTIKATLNQQSQSNN